MGDIGRVVTEASLGASLKPFSMAASGIWVSSPSVNFFRCKMGAVTPVLRRGVRVKGN